MAKTNLIENMQSVGNFDTDITRDTSLMQSKQLEKIVLLDTVNSGSELIKDDVDITYFRKFDTGERTEYEDEDGNKGYQTVFNFGREDFAGTIAQVCLASCDFIDPRYSSGYTLSRGNDLQGTGRSYLFNDTSYLTGYSKVLDCDFENGTLLTFEIKYENDEWSGVFYKWSHNLRNFRIGGAQSYFYLNEVISVDIGDLVSIPNGQGGWDKWTDFYGDGNLFCGIDEVNNRYVIVFAERTNKVFNTLILPKEDITQTELHKMILPNEVSWASNHTWDFGRRKGFKSNYILIYKGKVVLPLYTTRLVEEQEISDVYACLINPEDSTDIKALETHCYNTSGTEVDWNSNMPWNVNMPLLNSGCGSAIASSITVKKDIAYLKQVNGLGKNWGFYYKGFMLNASIAYSNGYANVTFKWNVCPITLAITETLTKPFLKTLNKTLKYTFRIVNTGGNFYD